MEVEVQEGCRKGAGGVQERCRRGAGEVMEVQERGRRVAGAGGVQEEG